MYNEGMAKEKILSHLKELRIKYPGRSETDLEMEKRFRYELVESKRILEEKLSKKVTI